jgi:chromosome segregation ATPase
MFKKIGITALVLVVALALLGQNRYLRSWGTVLWDSLTSCAKARVTPEMEIKRIKVELGNLDNDIKKAYHALAVLEVGKGGLKELAEDVKVTRENLDSRKHALEVLDKDPEAGDARFAQAWETYKIAEATLATKEKLLKGKQDLVRLNKEKVDKMEAERDRLKTEVAKLETDLASLRLSQTQSPTQVDDTRLGDIKTAISDLRQDIDVMQKDTEYQARLADDVKVDVQVKGAQARAEFHALQEKNKATASNWLQPRLETFPGMGGILREEELKGPLGVASGSCEPTISGVCFLQRPITRGRHSWFFRVPGRERNRAGSPCSVSRG